MPRGLTGTHTFCSASLAFRLCWHLTLRLDGHGEQEPVASTREVNGLWLAVRPAVVLPQQFPANTGRNLEGGSAGVAVRMRAAPRNNAHRGLAPAIIAQSTRAPSAGRVPLPCPSSFLLPEKRRQKTRAVCHRGPKTAKPPVPDNQSVLLSYRWFGWPRGLCFAGAAALPHVGQSGS